MISPTRIFGAIGLTGGGPKALDSFPSNMMEHDHVALVVDGTNILFYVCDASSNLNENIPYVVKPNDAVSPTNYKRWILISSKYFNDDIIQSVGKFIQTNEIKPIGGSILKLTSAGGTSIEILPDGTIKLNNTIVQGQITVVNDGRRPPFVVDSILRVVNLNADRVDGFDATAFIFANNPITPIVPSIPDSITNKLYVDTKIQAAIDALDISVDLTTHISTLTDDHQNYVHVDGRRGFTGAITGITPTLDNHLATKEYVDNKINSGNLVLPHALSDTWTLTHNFGSKYVAVTVYGNDDNEITAKEVNLVDYNTVEVTFETPFEGYAVISGIVMVGGPDVPPFVIEGDHGSLTGLLDDDHLNYVPVNGSRGFTNTVSGISPVLDSHLATKGYIDSEISGIQLDHSQLLNSTVGDDHLQYVHIDSRRGFQYPVTGKNPIYPEHLATKEYVDAVSGVVIATVQRGIMTLVQSTDNITVTLESSITTGYSVAVTLENLIDGSPSMYSCIIRRKTNSEFDVEFSSNIDSPNYKLNWTVYPLSVA